MKKINVRDVRNNFAKYLKVLPFVITRHGKPIARVIEVLEDERPRTISKYIPRTKVIKTKKDAEKAIKVPGFCEHGVRSDLCVFLKCRKKVE